MSLIDALQLEEAPVASNGIAIAARSDSDAGCGTLQQPYSGSTRRSTAFSISLARELAMGSGAGAGNGVASKLSTIGIRWHGSTREKVDQIGDDTNPARKRGETAWPNVGVTVHRLLTRPPVNRREFASRTDEG